MCVYVKRCANGENKLTEILQLLLLPLLLIILIRLYNNNLLRIDHSILDICTAEKIFCFCYTVSDCYTQRPDTGCASIMSTVIYRFSIKHKYFNIFM